MRKTRELDALVATVHRPVLFNSCEMTVADSYKRTHSLTRCMTEQAGRAWELLLRCWHAASPQANGIGL